MSFLHFVDLYAMEQLKDLQMVCRMDVQNMKVQTPYSAKAQAPCGILISGYKLLAIFISQS
jgi:hypothetical protein